MPYLEGHDFDWAKAQLHNGKQVRRRYWGAWLELKNNSYRYHPGPTSQSQATLAWTPIYGDFEAEDWIEVL